MRPCRLWPSAAGLQAMMAADVMAVAGAKGSHNSERVAV
jgi:hypothetical protein